MTTLEPARRRASRFLRVSVFVALVPVLALLVSLEPLSLLVLLAAGFVLFAFEAPVAAVGLVLFLHIAMPVYIKAPVPGGFYNPPISTTLLLALVGVGMLAYLARAPLPPPLARGGRLVVTAFFIFAAALALSLIGPRIGAKNVETWLSVFFFPGLVCASILCTCRGATDIRRLSMFLMAGGVVASLYAVVEYVLGKNPLLEMLVADQEIEYWTRDELGSMVYRCFSVYTNPLQFGMVMGMIFPFAAVRTAMAERAPERLFFAFIAGFIALGVVLTFSRGPLLALIAGSVATAVLCKGFRPWLAGGALATVAMGIVVWSSMGGRITERIGDVDNMTLRLKLWKTALAIFSDHPIGGVGIGNFYQYYLGAIRENHIGPFYEFGQNRVAEIHVAENTYLQLAAETGIIGLLTGATAVLMFFYLCFMVWRNARDPRIRSLAIAVGISAFIYLSNGLFITAYTFFFGTMLFLGFLPGALLVLDRAEAHRTNVTESAAADGAGPES